MAEPSSPGARPPRRSEWELRPSVATWYLPLPPHPWPESPRKPEGEEPAARAGSPEDAGLRKGEELEGGPGPFDPTRPPLLSELAERLGFAEGAVVEEMQGFRGGLNEGVWFLRGAEGTARSGEELVLKLVRGEATVPDMPTEADNFFELQKRHSAITNDKCLAFPIRILGCRGDDGKRLDLVVMRRARGERLSEYIPDKLFRKSFDPKQEHLLMRMFERVGACLREFHALYADEQHADCSISNVFYHEETESVCFIDLGGMGIPGAEGDVEHFLTSLKFLAVCYGEQLVADGVRHFMSGYDAADSTAPPRHASWLGS